MKTFREYLMEAERQGTYAKMELDKKSRTMLHDWLEEKDIQGLVEPEEYHCTVTYSRKACPEISKLEPELPLKVNPIDWDIFGDKNLLVLKLTSEDLQDLYKETRDMGATSDYPEYIPHISVAINYEGEVPKDLPPFKIVFDEFVVEELDLDFEYDTDGETE